jgi:hypothetical protein
MQICAMAVKQSADTQGPACGVEKRGREWEDKGWKIDALTIASCLHAVNA